MTLFVLTAFLNTVQSDGVQGVPLIQLLDMYSVRGCKVAGALRWRRVNVGQISFSGRKCSISVKPVLEPVLEPGEKMEYNLATPSKSVV